MFGIFKRQDDQVAVAEPETKETSEFEDRYIICQRCGDEFVWEAGEQQFYTEKQLSAPKRCLACRRARRNYYGEGG